MTDKTQTQRIAPRGWDVTSFRRDYGYFTAELAKSRLEILPLTNWMLQENAAFTIMLTPDYPEGQPRIDFKRVERICEALQNLHKALEEETKAPKESEAESKHETTDD